MNSEYTKENVGGLEFEIESRELDISANNTVLQSIQKVLDYLDFNLKDFIFSKQMMNMIKYFIIETNILVQIQKNIT